MMKKRGLLVWFEMDKRPELLQPFIKMNDEIEFIHLFFRTRSERLVDVSPFEVTYWFDFKSPYQLLKKYKPDFIIGTTEGLLAISLIAAAKEKGIPYYGLQHGFTPESLDSLLPRIRRNTVFSITTLKKYFNTSRFYFSSFRLKNAAAIFQYFKVFFSFYTMNLEAAIRKNKYAWIKPHSYICFSEYSCSHYRDLYNLSPSELKFIGIPGFDEFFKGAAALTHTSKEEKYYVLIDTNFEEYFKPITQDQVRRCYQTLAEYCRINNAKLYIKLHPWSYKYDHYTDDDVISFIRNITMEDLGRLISGSEGCFGFYSTLTMPIAFTKSTIQIRYDDVFEPVLAESNLTPVLDFYSFQLADIQFYPLVNSNSTLKTKFLFATDGNSAERLKQILIN